MTEKLYYLDSHLFDFSACAESCVETGKGWAVSLDRTAFFPEGGGQAADTGFIGGVRVVNVQEKNGEILHFVESPVQTGEAVECSLDSEQRLRRMQNHSGEHIVSGIAHNRFSFENVGFHMGNDCMTIDFSGELSWDELMEIETEANEAVRANIPVRTFFPEPEELKALEYRSKLELTHDVRIVEIPGIDRCACCAPHVLNTGEIGVIKILDFMRHRGGVRVSLVCGMDALDIFRLQQRNITGISNLLSAKREDTAEYVAKLIGDRDSLKETIAALSRENVLLKLNSVSVTESNICRFESLLNDVSARELVNGLSEKTSGIAAVFIPSGEGFRYIIGSRSVNLRECAKQLNFGINGRGGGSPEMIQGSCSASRETVEDFIMNFKPQ